MATGTPNVVINPYHGNYQANIGHSDAQMHSVVSMRSAGRQSLHSNRNGHATKTVESTGYPVSGNVSQDI
ncbi:hypothetical protein BLA29_014256, partial [Euroglyphus maynei]